jgi:hypothetical protein
MVPAERINAILHSDANAVTPTADGQKPKAVRAMSGHALLEASNSMAPLCGRFSAIKDLLTVAWGTTIPPSRGIVRLRGS